MASTYSPNLRIELIGYGEQNNTWGTTTNTNLGTLIEQAIAGKAAVDVTAGNVTLTAVDGATDQSRQMILAITGTPGVARTVTAPSVSKVYVVANGSNATITIKMATGTGVTVSSGKAKFVYCNGTDFYEATTEQASAVITDLTVTGNTILGNATADTVTINGTIQPGVVISGSSSSDAIRITQTGTGNALVVEDSANPDSTPFVIDANGQVGIGISGPIQPLTIASTSFGINVFRYSATPSSSGGIDFRKSASGTVGTNTNVINGESLGRVLFSGYDGAGYIPAGQITVEVDGAPGLNDMPGRIIFSTTADGASSSTERMRIQNTGKIYLENSLGTSATANLVVGQNISGGTTAFGIISGGTVQSAVTSAVQNFNSGLRTQAAAFVLGSYNHFIATQQSIGAGSSVTNQYGFAVESSLTGATNNYGFYSAIASGTGRYSFYAAGTAENYFAGKVGVGVSGSSSGIANAFAITGGVNAQGYRLESTINSDVTNQARGYVTFLSTQATAFTLSNLYHYQANQNTIGAGSTVTSQAGFIAESTLTGATNNYGFYSNIAAPTSGGSTASSVASVSSTGTTVTVNTAAAHGLSNGQTVTISLTANATALVAGVTCTILVVGSTDFTLIGASSNTVGVSFTATGVGVGSGTVTLNQQNSGKTITVVNTTQFTYTASSSATFTLITASGTVTPTKRYNFYAAGNADNFFEGNVKTNGALAGGYSTLSAGATAMALGSNKVVKVTPNATASFTTTVAPAGATASIIIVTSGTTSYTITFGTGFLTTGTLATGTVTAKTFVVNFVSDGTTMIETSRTVAM